MLINELVKISGVSHRTLRYYDEIGLLRPAHIHENGYREYTETEVNLLQQILFYRELGFSLEKIKEILQSPHFSIKVALQEQRVLLLEKREYVNRMIETVTNTLQALEEDKVMENEEKFNVFKSKMIEKNEQQYGKEIRERHGEESVLASYGKLKELSAEQFEAVNQLEEMLFERLKEAMEIGNPNSEVGYEVAELHKRWLCFYWPKYTKAAHNGLAKMYVMDERFVSYYDNRVGIGATQFLHDAIDVYTTN